MKKIVYAMSALSIMHLFSVHTCPICMDAAGNIDKPYFYEDEEGRKLDEKGKLLIENH